jgi:cell wall-associated NlpC family hydrolase
MFWRPGTRAAGLGSIALSMFMAACASTHTAPRPFPTPGRSTERSADTPSPPSADLPVTPGSIDGRAIVDLALQLRGIPYRNGGADPHGFDCSGFTQYVFAEFGQPLPRQTRDQFEAGLAVRKGEQQPGDLVFFTTVAPGASHVGIVIGPDAFVHAPSSRGVVRVESLSLPYWARRLVGIRRLAATAAD